MSVLVVYVDPGSFSGETEASAAAAGAVRAQIQSLRAQPVLLRRGAPLIDQFAIAMAGR
jgi:hypothetical protein